MTTITPANTRDDPKVAKMISELVGTLTDPILAWPQYADMKPPDFYREIITIQRLLENMNALHENREPLGTDAEAAWYISTRSFEAPMDDTWVRIYGYCFTKTWESLNREVPEDLRVDKLSDYEMNYHLLPFKRWLYQQRCQIRKVYDRQERKDRKEGEKLQQLDLQPAMFEF
ncbi:MAG: hypothetical protein PHU23_03265 [Dehalococcoidales bacterium]|nr:hypothetical protein [Dehalococcoidales bacterium]